MCAQCVWAFLAVPKGRRAWAKQNVFGAINLFLSVWFVFVAFRFAINGLGYMFT
jgi:hypothetical protein